MNGSQPLVPAGPSPLAAAALPSPTTVRAPAAGKPPRHFLALFYLGFFLGIFGADRFYLGRYFSGTLKLLTFGWFGVGALIDMALIMNNALRDRDGRLPVGYDEYKGTAKKTVFWITLIGALLFIVTAGSIAFSLYLIIGQYTRSGVDYTTLLNSVLGWSGGIPTM